MKKLKLIPLIIMTMMLCTGCSIEYNINVTTDTIEETINVVDNITYARTKNDILTHYNMWYPVFVNYIKDGETIEIEDYSTKANGVEYYNKNIIETDFGYNYTYKYRYDIDEYYDSYALASTFIEPMVRKNNKNLVLKSSKENLLCNYDYFEEIKVNITIDPKEYKLNYTNATDINDNTYSWTLNRSNCQNSQIILTLDLKNEIQEDINDLLNKNPDDKEDDNDKNKSDYSIYIFYGILVIAILILSVIYNKLKKKNDKMNEDD